MAHLIEPPRTGISIRECLDQLRAAHEVLRQAGARAARSVADLSGTADWGTQVKRSKVTLPSEPSELPPLLRKAPTTHSFAEVVNQCATVERMIDALTWAESAFPGWTVLACHPTTSSSVSAPDLNNDLVLCGPNDERARFEVSDVAGDNDGNRKEEKDLVNLGWFREVSPDGDREQTFLVVSSSFGARITKEGRPVPKRPHLAYHLRASVGETCIIQVRLR